MGLCSSKELPEDKEKRKHDLKASRKLEEKMAKDNAVDQKVNKLLLLGAGESGKSTLFKALLTIYGVGYPEQERKTFTPIIWNNIITSMKTLAEHSAQYGQVQTAEAAAAKKIFDEELKGDEELDARIGRCIIALWKDPGIRMTYEQRSRFQLFDSAEYFFDRIDIISGENYIPDEKDVLRSRVRTTGIVESAFDIDGNQFKMFDVGGQRNERKKWIHCFENVTAVIFVDAISEYDQVLFEDENTNRMDEAVQLFEEICNSKWFKETAMILFLNKRDLFEQKLKKVPLSVWRKEYTGDCLDQAVDFLRTYFESQNKTQNKIIYSHVTCATDTSNIAAVFNAVKDIIIRKSLTDAGLV